jgi:hypothetical protein
MKETTATTEPHVHDCTGPDMKCPCGYVFYIPPVSVSIDVSYGRSAIVNECFHCETVDGAIDAMEEAIASLLTYRDMRRAKRKR